ncbi:MAG TPA: branched-chain amino acid ABC transporter permease, partial [Erysipelotrichaceae bacterium]|nr:branched-chain amino acid ABC transporter permease [Erysipelotrichaceae bacterium]HBG84328.1 branched-chain amino acid ABC transporter permease [Erysipelotrichaceae bacterium]
MKKKLIRELVTALVLAVVVYAIFAIGFATGAINSYWQGILMLVGINVTLAVSLNLATGYLGQLT